MAKEADHVRFQSKMGFHASRGRILLESQAPGPETSRFLTVPVKVQRQNLHFASGEVGFLQLFSVLTGYRVSGYTILHQEKPPAPLVSSCWGKRTGSDDFMGKFPKDIWLKTSAVPLREKNIQWKTEDWTSLTVCSTKRRVILVNAAFKCLQKTNKFRKYCRFTPSGICLW